MKHFLPFLFVVAIGCGQSSQETKPPPGIRSTELHRAYKENEVAAALEYEGKTIQVWGPVAGVRKGMVDLAASDMPYDLIECRLGRQDDRLATLRKGDRILVNGRVLGKPGLSVRMDDCEIIEVLTSR